MRRALAVLTTAASVLLGCKKPAPAPPPTPAPPEREWQLLASELPSALLSVSGRSANDVYTVGADKGHGPLVLHFDGKSWSELHTGQTGDLWWVQALPNGPVFMAGAGGMVVRYDEHARSFTRMKTPGLANQTVYGVWASGPENLYAVGSSAGRNGFVWHFHDGVFENDVIPLDLPRVTASAPPAKDAGTGAKGGGEVPGFFKVFGMGDEVWVVGANGSLLHRQGGAPFTVIPTATKETLFTLHGVAGRILAVGGSGNGVLVEGTPGAGAFHDASPPAAGLLQGVFASDHGDWLSGERGMVYTRSAPGAAFAPVDHGLPMPAASSLHSIFVDGSGGVWSAGGNVLTPALDDGMLVHYGDPVPPVVIDEEGVAGDAG